LHRYSEDIVVEYLQRYSIRIATNAAISHESLAAEDTKLQCMKTDPGMTGEHKCYCFVLVKS